MNKVQPLVSIVMPVWNGQRYLRQAIQSILSQTYRNLEIIIVDDASSDESPEIIKDMSNRDSRIRVITNTRNLKLPSSLNLGFEMARGEWFTWTSDDNLLEPECIELLIKNAINYGDLFLYTDYKIIDEEGNLLGTRKTGPSNLVFLENVIGANFIYRRDLAEIIGGYDSNRFLYEDYDYWVRASVAGYYLRHIPGISPYRYRLHSGQLSSTRKLPKSFFYYRYGLIELLENEKLKQRAFLSLFRQSFHYRMFTLTALTFFRVLYPRPIVSLVVAIEVLKGKLK